MVMTDIRTLFETWYVSNRKVETDCNGNPPVGYIGNHLILQHNRTGNGYLYLRPNICWKVFIHRMAIDGLLDNERDRFESWYRDYQHSINTIDYVNQHWSDMIKHNGLRYVSDIVMECARTWSYAVLLKRGN